MKYSIFINQAELADTELDLTDCAILDWLYHYSNSKNPQIEAKRFDGWTWISYANLMSDMPLLRITNRSSISRRITKLRDAGFIATLLKVEKTFVKMTEKTDSLYFSTVAQTQQSSRTVAQEQQSRCAETTDTVAPKQPTSNTNITSNTKTPEQSAKAPAPKEIADKFFKDVFDLVNLPKGEAVPPELGGIVEMMQVLHERNPSVEKKKLWAEIKEFCAYWNELNQTGTKKRWQMQKTFEVSRRLKTWFDRAKFSDFQVAFNNQKPKGKEISI